MLAVLTVLPHTVCQAQNLMAAYTSIQPLSCSVSIDCAAFETSPELRVDPLRLVVCVQNDHHRCRRQDDLHCTNHISGVSDPNLTAQPLKHLLLQEHYCAACTCRDNGH